MSRSVVHLVAAAAVGAGILIAPQAVTTPEARAACAGNSGRSISGTFYGEDNRDVNVSIGFDVQDSAGRDIDVDPTKSTYGCVTAGGGYSVYPIEYNHYVTGQGAPQRTLMKNGQYTTRTWSLRNLPSNASRVWIEVYSRGYTGSPCTTCMNPGDVSKYGYANRHWIPVGATNVPLVLPMNCGSYGGRNGYITGTVKDRYGKPVTLKNIYAWTTYNNSPVLLQGWGSGRVSSGSYQLVALASRQNYTVWAITQDGRRFIKYNVPVYDCKSTPVNWVV